MFESEATKIKNHAISFFPREACGLILKDEGYRQCKNVHDNPQESFRIDPSIITAYADRIQAVVHSHPQFENDYPSESDMKSQIAMNIPWGICATDGKRTSTPFFFGNITDKAPLIGRGFRHGVTDCYSLIRDYYVEEFSVVIPEIPRSWEWWNTGKDLYRDFLEFAGFEVCDVKRNPKKGDICFFAIRSRVANHAGIYLGDGTVLHHLCGKSGIDLGALSRRESIARRVDSIVFWARYKEFK